MQFIHAIARCDRIVDCHDHSDESGCGGCPPGTSQCEGSDICIYSKYLCDGVDDCPLEDDENCIDSKCPDGCICGEGPYAHFFGPSRAFCAAPGYLPYWTNGTTTWNQQYAMNTTLRTVVIDLHDIPIGHLDPGSFNGATNLNTLDLTNCDIDHLPSGVFDGAPRLYKLYIRNNKLKYLEKGTFRGLYNLYLLFAEFNFLTQFDDGCFEGLTNLFFIDLEKNGITDFRPGTFRDLGGSLERLIITRNNLTSINSSLFYGLEDSLFRVNMDNNELKYIEPGTFRNMTALQDVVLASLSTKPWTLYPEVFEGLSQLKSLHVNDPRLCCLAPAETECVLRIPPHPLFTCRKTFLQNKTIKFFIWFLGVSALIGNFLVIVMRLNSKPATPVAHIQSMFITNLAASDFLMGVYMVFLAIMDIYIGESYFWQGLSTEWRSSALCQFAGFISIFSSEASVFLLTLISVDRFICILFPFSTKRLTVTSARMAIVGIWCFALLLSLTGVLLNNLYPDAYSLSDVCVGLPFIRKSTNLQASQDDRTTNTYQTVTYFTEATSSISTWQFSIALFLGINLMSFLVILCTYIAIFIKVRFTRAEAGKTNQRSHDVKMAIRMFLIVGTDFCCWMPIIILGVLVQTIGVEVTPDIYAWLVVFVLPINSSLNPYLYTIVHSV
nr:G-protein coupled receptor GRL101-like [Lytechinus pictus]